MSDRSRKPLLLALVAFVLALAAPVLADDPSADHAAIEDAARVYIKEHEGRRIDPPVKPPGGNGAVVPEPGTIALLGLGLATLGVVRNRRKNRK